MTAITAKRILKTLYVLIVLACCLPLLYPYLDKSGAFSQAVRSIGYIESVLIIVLPLIALHMLVSYCFDKETFSEYYNRQKILYGVAALFVIACCIAKIM
ncbi:hypothetical protein HYN48_08405 [Flavobacterium magnum]|uniref:Uncharacterized protein n=1 Tax=Flavobacterium magnum TaxID=2162713 RepID=A0A2S0RDS8_9FLAO|nr:hypothetical protein [Flavobacterium magnum]AWA30097.1 hypothetical protein HYN48_08405 [Flavobacterium magnum]